MDHKSNLAGDGDRMSENDDKLPYLHQVTKKLFSVGFEKYGTLSIYEEEMCQGKCWKRKKEEHNKQ